MEQNEALTPGESREQQLLPAPKATAPVFDSTRPATSPSRQSNRGGEKCSRENLKAHW